MSGVNKVILLGNLGKDPEVRHLETGRAVAQFSLATNEVYKNKQGEKVESTEWHNIVLWTPYAEIAEKYLKKGNQVYIEGKLTRRSYEDKKGIIRYITEVVGRSMTLLNNGGSSRPLPPDPSVQDNNPYPPNKLGDVEDAQLVGEDDLPF